MPTTSKIQRAKLEDIRKALLEELVITLRDSMDAAIGGNYAEASNVAEASVSAMTGMLVAEKLPDMLDAWMFYKEAKGIHEMLPAMEEFLKIAKEAFYEDRTE